jgi:hypothetical protein
MIVLRETHDYPQKSECRQEFRLIFACNAGRAGLFRGLWITALTNYNAGAGISKTIHRIQEEE